MTRSNSQSEGADGFGSGIQPTAEMKDGREKRNTLGVEKRSAAETILLVNWQPANMLITKFLYDQEKTGSRTICIACERRCWLRSPCSAIGHGR